MQENTETRLNEVELNVQALLLLYLKKWWIIAICAIVAAVGTFLVTWKFVTPTYQATVSIYVNNNRATEEKEGLTNSDMTAALRLVNTYVSIATSDRVLEQVAEKLGGDYTASQLRGCTRAQQLDETEIFCIHVVHPDRQEAARIANAAAEVAPAAISELIDGTSARVIDTAKVPTGRHSPNYTSTAAMGGFVGILIALVLMSVIAIQDTRIMDENDLRMVFDLSVLGRIPDFEDMHSSSGSYGYGTAEEKKKEGEKE